MSVINKMLRDLDQRRTANVNPVANPQARTDIARDTLIVHDSEPPQRKFGWAAWLAACVVLAGAAAAVGWYLNKSAIAPSKVAAVQMAPLAPPVKPLIAVVPGAALAVPASVPTQVPVPTMSASVPVVSASVPVVAVALASAPMAVVTTPQMARASADISLRMDSNIRALTSPETVSQPKPRAVATPRPAPEPLLKERAPGTKTVKPRASALVPTAAGPLSPPPQSSVQEALAQAQSLWNSDSHQAAIDLLQEALRTVERTSAAPTGNNLVLASLVRELCRMELAEGRVRQTLELLTRLEPALSGVADIWAIRGNAAQRLGRHADSAAAYQMALKLRPNEPRWQLGAAVSLAAQGKTAAAAELAEKARSGGALTPEVANYLRQLGVPLSQR